MELKFISSEKEVEELKNSGYSFGIYPCLKVDKTRFKVGAQMTAVFADRELVYRNWLGLTRESALKFGPFLKHLGYEGQVMGSSAETDPRYRGKGIFQYAVASNIKHLKEIEKNRLLTFVNADNLASRKVQEKSGLTVKYSGYKIRLCYLWDFFRVQAVPKCDASESRQLILSLRK